MDAVLKLDVMFENLKCEEFKEMLKDKEHYDYFSCALKGLINGIRTFIIFPPYEKNYINKLKENFIELKETFKETRYILYMIKYHFKTQYIHALQYPLDMMDEIELNIIDKLLNDSLKSEGRLSDLILLLKKLSYFLKYFYNLEERDDLNARGIFNISQYKDYYNIDDKQLLNDKEIFDILPL